MVDGKVNLAESPKSSRRPAVSTSYLDTIIPVGCGVESIVTTQVA